MGKQLSQLGLNIPPSPQPHLYPLMQTFKSICMIHKTLYSLESADPNSASLMTQWFLLNKSNITCLSQLHQYTQHKYSIKTSFLQVCAEHFFLRGFHESSHTQIWCHTSVQVHSKVILNCCL